ncbi:MAG: bifunctional diguanylate cyclase/phosphodiesterase [Acidimicrobiales bacterium]|nr:bifunctional diguanylate cyclase/phosphodiesterase [Acidimicrobiales bacterium]
MVAATGAAGVLAATATWFEAGGEGFGNPALLLTFTALLALSWAFPLLLPKNDETEGFQLDEAFFVASALLLPPCGTVAVFLVGVLAGLTVRRTPWPKVVFNVGQVTAAASLGVAAVHLLRPGPLEVGSPFALLAIVAGALVFLVVNTGLVAAVVATTEGTSVRATVLDGLGARLLQWASAISIGLLAGLGGSAYAWAPLFAVLPMGMVHVVLAEHLRAARDRQRVDGLFRTAVQAHASVRTDDVVAALTRSAEELLRCRSSRVGHDPPGSGERGAMVSAGGGEQWLVVADRRGTEPFGEQDDRLLEAIAAVGSSALENAHLVEEIRHQATHDRLTGLPNQLLFDDRVTQAVARARRLREQLALLVLDLDAFKKVNESRNHQAGDELLRQVAARLRRAARESDTVARMSGDHFTVLLPGVGSPETALVVAEKLLAELRRPFVLDDGHELFMSASLGIALFPAHGDDGAGLLRNADSAMHQAKEAGGDDLRLYDVGMNREARQRVARETELHNALARRELRVVYQPQVDLRTHRIIGVEALVRWEHPEHGLLAPVEFVPLAEQSGLIVEVDAFVLRAACRQARAWSDAGLPPVRMAVNLSGRHFHGGQRLVGMVTDALEAAALDPAMLEVEITEGLAVRESQGAFEVLARLRDAGVHIAIDDFGTGYSALARMHRFPVDRLKIDRSFVNTITAADGNAPLVSAFLGIARGLRLGVIAEGVETVEQAAFLRRHGCHEAQGFLFSRPVDPDEVARLLRSPSLGLHVGHQG